MKQKKYIVMAFFMVFGFIGIYSLSITNRFNDKIEYSEQIVLNKLAISASGESVSDVMVAKKERKNFNNKSYIYKMEEHKYSNKDIKNIIKCLGTSIKRKDRSEETFVQYDLDNGGYLSHFENTGGVVYIADSENINDIKGNKFDKLKCREIAEKFITNSNIIDINDLELKKEGVAECVETENGVEELSYELCYIKKGLDNMEFYGVGPGIKIEIASDYSICKVTSVDKEVTECIGKFDTLNEEKIIKNICDGDGVQVDGMSEGENLSVSVQSVELCLYSDPISLNQEYYAPYYVLKGIDSNSNDITIVAPAIEDEKISYK